MARGLALAGLAAALLAGPAAAQPVPPMGFFVTSAGPGRGADLGGLEGADRHCQALAAAVGAGGRRWHAYLSASATPTTPAVHARDRIGAGPWYNAAGILIAADVAALHGDANHINGDTAVTEAGRHVNGLGETPNTHDMLTGSQADGTAFAGPEDRTCRNWTYGGPDGAAELGHHDRLGIRDDAAARSWNSSHPSRGGCGHEALRRSVGAGLFYCFAID